MAEVTATLQRSFKETEIGPIPVDWDVVPLSQAAGYKKATINPQSHPGEEFDYYSIPAYQVSDEPALERGSEIRSQKMVVEPGMVLFGKLNPRVPKVWHVVSTSARRKIASTEFIPLVPIDGRTTSEFLYYLAWSDYVLPKSRELVSGSTPSRQRVDVKAFLCIPIPLPPLPEQHRIAHVLSTIQRAIAAQDDLIAAAREVKRSLMQRLFTYGPGAEPAPTKETEIGEIPEHWEVVPLKDAATFTRKPKGLKLSEYDTIPFIPMELISETGTSVDQYVPKPGNSIRSGTYCEKGDILLAKITPSFENGKQGIVGEIPLDFAYATTEVYPIRGKPNRLDQMFLFHFLKLPHVRADIAGKMEGSTGRQRIPKAVVENYSVPLPSLPEQRDIARMLSTVDRKIEAEEQRKAALQALFKFMLHQLMTGQVRLRDVEFEG